MEDDLNHSQMEDDLNFRQMEDDLNFLLMEDYLNYNLTYSVMSCNDMLGRVQVHVKDMFMSIAPNIIYLVVFKVPFSFSSFSKNVHDLLCVFQVFLCFLRWFQGF